MFLFKIGNANSRSVDEDEGPAAGERLEQFAVVVVAAAALGARLVIALGAGALPGPLLLGLHQGVKT